LTITRSDQFKKDYQKVQKQWDIVKLDAVIQRLVNGEDLSKDYKIYPLDSGFLKKLNYSILFIQPGWGLLYKVNAQNDEIVLARTGDPRDIS
jgi:addiction module RelE/StbE family toxin